jgi:phosphoglycolate phosphatase-like HAD superfamily hydrolase
MPDILVRPRQLWLFDLDGTLVAPSEDQLNAWVATFREVFGLVPSPAAIAPHLGLTFAGVVDAVLGSRGPGMPGSQIREALAVYTRHVRAALAARPARLLPGVRDLLAFLRQERGHLVGVVTGNFSAEGEPKLAGVSLRRFLDVVVYADLAASARDNLLRQALKAARTLGFAGDFADTVVVGDTVHDVESARCTGAVAIAVCTGLTPPDRLLAAGPDLLVAGLEDLLAILRHAGSACMPGTRSG